MNSTKVKKVEAVSVAVAPVAAIVPMTPAPGVEIVPNYTEAQLVAYLDSIESGKALDHPPFDQKLGETNFTDEDHERIRFSRKAHRAIVSNPSYRDIILAAISDLTLAGHKESANGVTTTLRLRDEALAETIRQAKATERAKDKKNTVVWRVTPSEKEAVLAMRQLAQAEKIAAKA
jgi:hypothetical protein